MEAGLTGMSYDKEKKKNHNHVAAVDVDAMVTYKSREFLCDRFERNWLGSGTYSHVLRFYHKNLGTVAVKICRLTGSAEGVETKIKEGRREARRFANLCHKHIVKFFGIVHELNNFGIVLKMVHGGNLEDLLLDEIKGKTFPWQIRLRIIIQISDALDYLHTHDSGKPLVHGDLKPQNILLTLGMNVRLGDLGSIIAQVSRSTSQRSTQHTWQYTAPERLRDILNASYYTDIYSLAIITYEVITWKQAFKVEQVPPAIVECLKKESFQKPDQKLFDATEKLLQNEEPEKKIFDKLKETAVRCWNDDPSKRPCADKVHEDLKDFARKKQIKFPPIKKKKELIGHKSGLNKKTLHDIFHYGTQINIERHAEIQDEFIEQVAEKILILRKNGIVQYKPMTKTIAKMENMKLNQEAKEGIITRMGDFIYLISKQSSNNLKRISLQNQTETWEEIQGPKEVFEFCACTVFQDELYLVGGIKERGEIPEKKFNPTLEKWIKIRELRKRRHGHALVALNDSLYAIGGYKQNSVEIYNRNENSWRTSQATMLNERCGLAAVALGGKLYAIGGYDDDANTVLSSVEVFHPETERWSKTGQLKEKRCWHGACVVAGKIYVIGGQTNTVEEFDPATEEWRIVGNHEKFYGVRSIVAL